MIYYSDDLADSECRVNEIDDGIRRRVYIDGKQSRGLTLAWQVHKFRVLEFGDEFVSRYHLTINGERGRSVRSKNSMTTVKFPRRLLAVPLCNLGYASILVTAMPEVIRSSQMWMSTSVKFSLDRAALHDIRLEVCHTDRLMHDSPQFKVPLIGDRMTVYCHPQSQTVAHSTMGDGQQYSLVVLQIPVLETVEAGEIVFENDIGIKTLIIGDRFTNEHPDVTTNVRSKLRPRISRIRGPVTAAEVTFNTCVSHDVSLTCKRYPARVSSLMPALTARLIRGQVFKLV